MYTNKSFIEKPLKKERRKKLKNQNFKELGDLPVFSTVYGQIAILGARGPGRRRESVQ